MEIKTSSSPTHCSKYFLPLKIRGSSGDIMKEEGSSRRIGLKRKRSRIGKMKDILTHRRGENSNDVGGCGGDTYYLPEKLGNKPLRCVFVGINPSEVAWQQGHYYANPTNRFWPLLRKTGIVPDDFGAEDDDRCLSIGIGFTDLGHGYPETKSNKIKASILEGWRDGFYARLIRHALRAAQPTLGGGDEMCPPRFIAFTGCRQWQALYEGVQQHGYKRIGRIKVEYGCQGDLRPPGWPFSTSDCRVFVLTSSSGAAAITNAQREAPYIQLATELAKLP